MHAEIADRKVLVDCAEDVLVVGEWDGGRETCLADIHNAREKRMKSWRISSYRPVVFFSLTDLYLNKAIVNIMGLVELLVTGVEELKYGEEIISYNYGRP